MENAFRAARRMVGETQAVGGLRCVEVLPGPLFASDSAALRSYFALFSNTYFHACGTCAMDVHVDGSNQTESDPISTTGVVDARLRVHGISGLRVADASVIPAIPSSPISAICMVIGEIAGELILSEQSITM